MEYYKSPRIKILLRRSSFCHTKKTKHTPQPDNTSESLPSMSTIHVQTLLGGIQTLQNVDLQQTTLYDLRHRISPPFPSYSADPSQLPQRWLHSGREIADDRVPLQQCNIKHNDTLTLLLKVYRHVFIFVHSQRIQ